VQRFKGGIGIEHHGLSVLQKDLLHDGAIHRAHEEGTQLNFTLIYRGALPAESRGSSRVKEKHVLRKAFHKQLKELWRVQPTLVKMAASNVSIPGAAPGQYVTFLEATANKYARCGFRFIPVIAPEQSLSCDIDVLFLRRDHPGNLIRSGGDIDNRLKIIFDALRMPDKCDELPTTQTDADENPFFVLLENDSLITKVTVSSDRLLVPLEAGEHIHNVHLIIRVTVNVIAVSYYHGTNTMFLGS
jgi:hypothetical protein